MDKRVYKVGETWKYIQVLEESKLNFGFIEFDAVDYVPITDCYKMQTCIIRKGDQYGVYLLDRINAQFETGTWCSPTLEPFPYDEVKYCSFPWDEEYGIFAFRIGDKWGIIKVVDSHDESKEQFDFKTGFAKRRIAVPYECASISEAEQQYGQQFKWEEFKEQEEDL